MNFGLSQLIPIIDFARVVVPHAPTQLIDAGRLIRVVFVVVDLGELIPDHTQLELSLAVFTFEKHEVSSILSPEPYTPANLGFRRSQRLPAVAVPHETGSFRIQAQNDKSGSAAANASWAHAGPTTFLTSRLLGVQMYIYPRAVTHRALAAVTSQISVVTRRANSSSWHLISQYTGSESQRAPYITPYKQFHSTIVSPAISSKNIMIRIPK